MQSDFIRLLRLLAPRRRLSGNEVAAIAIRSMSSGRLKGPALYLTVFLALVSVVSSPAAIVWAAMHVYRRFPSTEEATPALPPAVSGGVVQAPNTDRLHKADEYPGHSPNYSREDASPPPLQSPHARSGAADQSNGS